MKTRSLIAVLGTFLLAASAGCSGILDPGSDPGITPPGGGPDAGTGGGGSAAKQLFDTNVKPLLTNCNDAACHAGPGTYPPKFLGTGDDTTWYDSVVATPEVTGNFDPSLASLISHLATTHQGLPAWTTAQTTDITNWMLAERDERGLDDPNNTPPGDPLAEWSGCMTLDNWNAAGMGDWAQKTAEGGTVCSSCHGAGLKQFDTNTDSDTMFARNRYEVFITGFFTVTNGKVVPAYDKITTKSNGDNNHPTFQSGTGDPYYQKLQNFYDLTMAAKNAGTCGPAQFPAP